jgi:hypothetical protein
LISGDQIFLGKENFTVEIYSMTNIKKLKNLI